MTVMEDQEQGKFSARGRSELLERSKFGESSVGTNEEGSISAITVREKKVFDKSAASLTKKQPDLLENDHEVFLGYESGAVGILRLWLDGCESKMKLQY